MPPFPAVPSNRSGLGRRTVLRHDWKPRPLEDAVGADRSQQPAQHAVLASLPPLLFCLFNLLLTPLLALPFVRKPLLVLLLVVSAACSYFMLHYNVLIDRSMVQNVFETNQAELNAYLSLPLLLTLLALGVLPAAGARPGAHHPRGRFDTFPAGVAGQRPGVACGAAGDRLFVLQGLLLAAAQQPLQSATRYCR